MKHMHIGRVWVVANTPVPSAVQAPLNRFEWASQPMEQFESHMAGVFQREKERERNHREESAVFDEEQREPHGDEYEVQDDDEEEDKEEDQEEEKSEEEPDPIDPDDSSSEIRLRMTMMEAKMRRTLTLHQLNDDV
ncbi:hypothetical protein OQA88_7545 [Cercophora sp. LCS_1]